MDSRYFEEYEEAAKESSQYFKIGKSEPKHVASRFKEALISLRDHLDDIGIKMPRAKYQFDMKDKSTWKYKDVFIVGLKEEKRYGGCTVNHFFKYK